ncbi:hypothetical protein AS160_10185 [Marinitoga sp. 38H-ov]|nr:hypothetical protein AS160_10185 [Marinitoga sp. 38H-ov]
MLLTIILLDKLNISNNIIIFFLNYFFPLFICLFIIPIIILKKQEKKLEYNEILKINIRQTKNKISLLLLITVLIIMFNFNKIGNFNIMIFFIIAFFEEFYYRGVIYYKIKKINLSIFSQILLNAIFFTFIAHNARSDISSYIYVFNAGIVLTFFRYYFDDLLIPILYHWIYNLITIISK